ncbi:hypothetical protein SAMN05216565_104127 [Litchfieldia salsa]|uniref:Uncharacterized protein n=1 Tax=Litchfieldia salsa TaxID=930152 RepID=A0A1H0U375_9BACI|nr:hypothetical protein SAMN05216565_104127 [Litchfieldia salsa]
MGFCRKIDKVVNVADKSREVADKCHQLADIRQKVADKPPITLYFEV